MKKVLLTITMIFISFFVTIPVNAEETNELIYDIESFNIDDANGQIIFKGWAFISNFHNYGGKNTTIKIEAYNSYSSVTLTKEVEYSSEKNLLSVVCQIVKVAFSKKLLPCIIDISF